MLFQLSTGLAVKQQEAGAGLNLSKRISGSTAPFWASPYPQCGCFSLAHTHMQGNNPSSRQEASWLGTGNLHLLGSRETHPCV